MPQYDYIGDIFEILLQNSRLGQKYSAKQAERRGMG